MILDISKYQGNIDFNKVKQAGVEGVIIKTTRGKVSADPMFAHNVAGALAAGLKIGYYHFAEPHINNSEADAKTQASWFVANIKKGVANTLPIALDIEENKENLSKAQLLQWINTFLSQLAQLGYTDYMIYSYTPFLDSNLPQIHGLGGIKLWVAAYSTHYHTPHGWEKPYLWQYSSTGKITGIPNAVDLNKYV